jgi:RhtB (resistance to homoserine/threonine) family protein
MTFLATWLTIVLICSFVIISPGPNLVVTLRNSLVHTRRAGIYTALGLAIGDLIHISGWLIGIGVIITQSLLLFNILKWLGAAYLIYIGIKSLQAQKHPEVGPGVGLEQAAVNQPGLDAKRAFRMGLLTCLLNPKVTLFFFALFTQLIQPGTPIWMQVIYGLTVVSIEFIWFSTVAVTISRPLIKRHFVKISHWLERAMGAVLIGLGIRLALAQNHE